MKAIKIGIIFMILLFSNICSFGQTEIFGHWKVGCYLEKDQDGNLCFCTFCPNKLENNVFKINDFELEIDNFFLKIIVDGKTTRITYKWDSTMDAITFEYEKMKYSFKVLTGTSSTNYILKENKCGGLLLLNKI